MKKKFRSLQTKLMLVMLLCISVGIIILVVLYLAGESHKHYIFLAALSLAFLIFFLFWRYIRRNIMNPIAIIIRSLRTENMDILKTIESDRLDDEWDLIVSLVKNDFEKTRILKFQSKELEEKAQQLEEQAKLDEEKTQQIEETTQQLKQEIATKNKFFDLIAHDLRTPFNVIMGFSQILIEEKKNFSSEEQEKFIKLINTAAINSHKLLEHLLEWARLQTGRLLPTKTKFDISKTIENVISFHLANAMHKNVALVKNIKESNEVYADESMINATIRNIVSNAIKFTQSGGVVMLSIEKHSNNLEIIVADNGKGMSPDILNALFKIGEKVISEDMTNKKGTGLGLILCKEFVERNGGKIWVESDLGKGSKFHFTIPLAN